MTESFPNNERKFDGIIRLAREGDIESLQSILEMWIRDRNTMKPLPDEVNKILKTVHESIQGQSNTTFVIAENNDGEVIGMMGFRPPEAGMIPYTTTSKPAELINAYVSNEHRGGKGVGKALVTKVKQLAKQRGYTEILLNSGPRYKSSGWPIWERLFGEPIAVAKEYYGQGGDAPVWREVF